MPTAFLSDVKSWVMTSSRSQRAYQISVALPDGYSETGTPFAVLYSVDANAQFGTVVETARSATLFKDVPPLVVVGIGYPNPGIGMKAAFGPRALDLTPTEDAAWVKDSADEFRPFGLPGVEGSGGGPAFLAFLREELIPAIEQTYNVRRDDRAFYGHSCGGLFGLFTLFEGNGLFQRFIIGSPSIWWNGRVILQREEAVASAQKVLRARVFLSVGALEQSGAPKYPMVTDLQTLADTLRGRHYDGLEIQAHIFEGEAHGSVVPATISKGLHFIYRPVPNKPLQPTSGESP
jgi:hypothetical protein